MDQVAALKRIAECGLLAAESFACHGAEKAQALSAAEIDCLEARGQEAAGAIREILRACPDVVVGAGDVRGEQACRNALQAGAAFVSTCGLDRGIAEICARAEAVYLPTCATAGEVYAAQALGIPMVKLFPAETMGGVRFVQALASRFPEIQFIPEGDLDEGEIGAFGSLKSVSAVSAERLCAEFDAGGAEAVKKYAENAVRSLLGFELYHIGINMPNAQASWDLAKRMNAAFGFDFAEGPFAFYSSRALSRVRDTLFNARGEA